ncbi:MAG: DmsC/YnfH family molybdoenzyme membrane anchor subunit, partial [Actinomycetota bacterium]
MFTELSMVVFTIFAQMSVGAFIVLGVVQLAAQVRGGRSAEEVDRITDPALYAVGVTLALGLIASVFHLGTPMNAINVLRSLDASWLSREIA